MPIREAQRIVTLQRVFADMIGALREEGLPGFETIYPEYEPCFRVVIRVTEGDGHEILEALPTLGFSEIAPYAVIHRAVYTQADLTRAGEAGSEALGDLATYSGSNLVNEKVFLGVAHPGDVTEAWRRLVAAIEDGRVELPREQFEIEVGVPEPT